MANNAPTTDSGVDYARLLSDEREDLRRQLAELGFGDTEGLSYDANFADSSQVSAERREAETLASELAEALEEVDAAIVRLAEGRYGWCERCGQPIAAARLEAMPAARRCITCASLP